jgi:hypothetical protein
MSEELPPFPDNVPTAPLLSISLSKLLQHNAEEGKRLWEAACQTGFFYLDLRKSLDQSNGISNDNPTIDGEELLDVVEKLFELGKRLFARDEKEKREFDYASKGSYFG